MRRWIGWAARCYPAVWRKRYGDEFAALLEDAEPHWRDVWDVLGEALSMQIRTPAAYLKFGVAMGLIGVIAACAASLAMPKRYVSTALLRASQPVDGKAERRFQLSQQDVLSRSSLTQLILQPGIDLYREDRRRYPLEDILQSMRDRDLKLVADPGGVRVTFEYEDPVKAQAVVRELSARLGDGVLQVVTPASLPDRPVQPDWVWLIATGLFGGMAVGVLLAFLRGRTARWILKMVGSLLAGGMTAVAICLLLPETFLDPNRVDQLVALGASCGMTLGAYLMRERNGRGNYAAQIAFCAAGCALVGALASFGVAERYVSSATLRVYPLAAGAVTPAERLRVLTEDALSRSSLTELVQRPSLDLYRWERQRYPMEDIIEELRTRDIKIEAESGAGLAVVSPSAAFRISFRYTDRFKAQAVVREMVTKYAEGNMIAERKLHPDGAPQSLAMEVIDPANLPQRGVSPNRPMYAGLGLAFGAVLGALLGWRRWRGENPPASATRPRYWKYVLPAGAMGIVAAAVGSLVIPDRYVSTAVLRVVVPPGQDAAARAQEMIAQLMTKDALTEIMQSPALDLYHQERMRRPMEEVLQRMRRDLRASIPPGPMGKESGPARTVALRISFVYGDRELAQGCVRTVINRLVEDRVAPAARGDTAHLFDNNLVAAAVPPKLESNASEVAAAPPAAPIRNPAELLGGAGMFAPITRGGDFSASTSAAGGGVATPEEMKLEILDAASRPESPVSPNRTTISMAGGLAGLMVGLVLARRRKTDNR